MNKNQHTFKIPFTLVALGFVLLHFIFLMFYFEPAISTPDANGYFAQAKRSLLPTFYIYTIAGVWLLQLVFKHHYYLAWAGAVTLLLITLWWGLPRSLRSMQHLKDHNAVLAKVTNMIEEHIKPGNIFTHDTALLGGLGMNSLAGRHLLELVELLVARIVHWLRILIISGVNFLFPSIFTEINRMTK